MKKQRTEDLKGEDFRKKIEAEEEAIAKRMGVVKHKLLVISGKGGVGKTTVAANLAIALANKGYKVGLMDVDLHGPNVPKMLGIEDEHLSIDPTANEIIPILVPPGLKVMSVGFLISTKDSPIIWRGPLKMKAINQFISQVKWGNLDYFIVDCPPGTGDEPLSTAQLFPLDGTIVVTTPQEVALLDSRKAVNFARELKVPIIGIIENMSGFTCPYCGKEIDLFKVGGGERSAKEMGVPFLGRIPFDPKMVDASDKGTPFVLQKRSKAIEAFEGITEKIRLFVEGERRKG
ncbi:MAG TPA: Mrp/NBP35 family ATP-binding protein [Thermoplasmata archaeon]|nr:Mrp/NBP35 family ATP-binding protein [Thermoplasmata archaeon]